MKEFWNERYSETDFAYGTEPNDFLLKHFKIIPTGGTVLCLAEGEGRNAIFLAKQGHKVTAVDFSDVGLMKAQERAHTENVELETIVADLNEFDFGTNKWDAIVSIFGHLPPVVRKNVHKKVQGGLKPGGLFILEAYTPLQLAKGTGGPPKVELMMDLKILNDELPLLKQELALELDRKIHEGKYHDGDSSVVQFIGRKAL